MNQTPRWQPSFKWHVTVFGIVLVGCLIGFGIFSYVAARLPAPYQPHHPAPAAMPWTNSQQESL